MMAGHHRADHRHPRATGGPWKNHASCVLAWFFIVGDQVAALGLLAQYDDAARRMDYASTTRPATTPSRRTGEGLSRVVKQPGRPSKTPSCPAPAGIPHRPGATSRATRQRPRERREPTQDLGQPPPARTPETHSGTFCHCDIMDTMKARHGRTSSTSCGIQDFSASGTVVGMTYHTTGTTSVAPELLTVQDAARLIGTSRVTITRLCIAGVLPATDVSAGGERRSLRIRLSDLNAFIASRQLKAAL